MFEEYNALVGKEQGGDNFFAKSGGGFYFADTKILADELLLAFLSPLTVTQHASADISGGAVLSPAYGIHVLSAATGMSDGQATTPVASKGATLYLNGTYLVGDANVSMLTVSTTGLVVNARGSDLSSFEMSAANYVKLACLVDGTWQVVEENNYTEHASS